MWTYVKQFERPSLAEFRVVWTRDNEARIHVLNEFGVLVEEVGYSGPGTGWTLEDYEINGVGWVSLVWTNGSSRVLWRINGSNEFVRAFALSAPSA